MIGSEMLSILVFVDIDDQFLRSALLIWLRLALPVCVTLLQTLLFVFLYLRTLLLLLL